MAAKYSETLRTGKPKTLGQLALESGYSATTAKRPKAITSTRAFQSALLAENAPLIAGLQEEINRIKNALRAKNLHDEDYRTLVASLDLLTKNYQLLSGGATERQVFVLPSQVMERNAIEKSTEAPALAESLPNNGSTEPQK